MGQKHWLDPLARRLLIATGQIEGDQPRGAPEAAASLPVAPEAMTTPIDRDLLELKLKQQPGRRLADAREVQLAAELGWRLDVNRATAADWLRLPGIDADQVDLLMRLQAGGVQLCGPDDLQRLLDLPPEVIGAWQPLLEYRWYGEPPTPAPAARLDLNRASERQLQQLGLSAARRARLLRERARRPFQDLADLQQRLQLPAEVIEAWIGKVCFSPAPAGPRLPLGSRQT